MRIYYNEDTNNVVLEEEAVYFGKGSLEALNNGDLITIKYKDLSYAEHIIDQSEVLDINGDSAGSNVTEVLAYLDLQFNNNGKVDGEGSFNGLNTTVIISDNRLVDGDIISIAFPSVLFGEVVNTTVVVNNQFTVSRSLISVLGSLVSGLAFKWIRIR